MQKAAQSPRNPTDARFNKIESELLLLKWMVGTALVGIFAPVIQKLLG